jgi:mono/diheme cytochrome c family protein
MNSDLDRRMADAGHALRAAPVSDPPVIAAARRRKRIPTWVLPVVALLPLWGFLYAESVSPPKQEIRGPVAEGRALFGACSGCHMADGSGSDSGGVGRPLWRGEVLKTFPALADQVAFIRQGSYAPGTPYGDPTRPGGQHRALGNMPPFTVERLTDAELTAVSCYVRIGLSGEDPAAHAEWCADGATVVVQTDERGIVDRRAPAP